MIRSMHLVVLACVMISARVCAEELESPSNKPASKESLTVMMPERFDEAQLMQKLSEKLNGEDLKWVVNPLAVTPQMKIWADQLTAGATNNEAKAKILFETLAQRMRETKSYDRGVMRTASDVFMAWTNTLVSFSCRDNALLYVALARAAGINAFDVYVQETSDQRSEPHDCAFIVIDNNGILVDPSFLSYGIRHKHFNVLNDLQVIALHMGQLPGLKGSEIAIKLAPELELVQINRFEKLLNHRRVNESREMLPTIKQLVSNKNTISYAEGSVALYEGRTELAVRVLRKAINENNANNIGIYHFRLAEAYAQDGNFHEARESLKSALRCPLMENEAKFFKNLVVNSNELVVWGLMSRGFAMMVQTNINESIRSFESAVKIKPDLVDGYELVGFLHYNRYDFRSALANFRKARELAPSDPYTHFYIWLISKRLGETNAAAEELRIFVDRRQLQFPNDWPSKIGSYLLGQMSDAELFKAADEMDLSKDGKYSCEAYFYAGTKRLIANDNATAEDYFKKCIATKASNLSEYTSAMAELRIIRQGQSAAADNF